MNAVEPDARVRFSQMYGALYGRIHAYAQRRVGTEAADEVAAETFLVAWRRLDAIPSEPLPWLYAWPATSCFATTPGAPVKPRRAKH